MLRKNEVSLAEKVGKLCPKWEGPYKIVEAYPSNNYKLARMDDNMARMDDSFRTLLQT